MNRRPIVVLLALLILMLIGFLVWNLLLADETVEAFRETFDAPGEWDSGDDANALAAVTNGQYEITVRASSGIYRGSSPQQFADGIYEVTATQLAGPIDNGYGLALRLDPDSNSFYMFEISGDGFVWAGLCEDGCDNQGWVASPAVNQGTNNPNHLKVVVSGPEMSFFVNDEEVQTINDDRLASGQVAFLVETFGGGGVQVAFDNFSVSPVPE